MMKERVHDNVSAVLFQLSEELLEKVNQTSGESEQKRIIQLIHGKKEAKVRRMVKFAVKHPVIFFEIQICTQPLAHQWVT